MDEMGSDTNKGRKKVIAGKHAMLDALRHIFDDTDGDNNPFHVTNCLTTRADGKLPIPPYVGHSAPTSNADVEPKLTAAIYTNILTYDPISRHPDPGDTGMNVFVTRSGSMTKDRFPSYCAHLVRNLKKIGQGGPRGEPVMLIFDGHASRWSIEGITYLMKNGVYCICLPGHTSIWSQPNDGGANGSFKKCLGEHLKRWRQVHRSLPGAMQTE